MRPVALNPHPARLRRHAGQLDDPLAAGIRRSPDRNHERNWDAPPASPVAAVRPLFVLAPAESAFTAKALYLEDRVRHGLGRGLCPTSPGLSPRSRPPCSTTLSPARPSWADEFCCRWSPVTGRDIRYPPVRPVGRRPRRPIAQRTGHCFRAAGKASGVWPTRAAAVWSGQCRAGPMR
jgi:hypothetical protein